MQQNDKKFKLQIYNEIIEIRRLTIETSKLLSPVLLISLMVDFVNMFYSVSIWNVCFSHYI